MLVGACLAFVLTPQAAQAQATAQDRALSETLFQEGKKLLDEGKAAEACPKLAESQRLDPGGGFLSPLLREARVFDVYRGEQVGEGRKSVAIHLVFQSPERTLTDEDAAELRGRVVATLGDRFDAELRA